MSIFSGFKKFAAAAAVAAVTGLAGGAAAGSYTVTDFDDGTDSHHSGYKYKLSAAGHPDDGNVDEASLITSADDLIVSGVKAYAAGKGAPAGGCYSGTYCAALVVSSLPAHIASPTTPPNEYQPEDGYYPNFSFIIPLVGDNVSGWADFANVDSVVFYAKTESPGVQVQFKIQTSENWINGIYSDGERPDYPGIPKTNTHTNAYMAAFNPTAAWTRFAFAVKPVTAPTSPIPGAAISIASPNGRAGDLRQGGYYGTAFTFNPANVREFVWAIDSDKNSTLKNEPASVFIDNVQLVGSPIAGYSPEIFKVTFDANDGTVSPASGTTGADWTLAALPTPTRTGYAFNGWYTAATGGTSVTAAKVYSASTTVYAQWTLDRYTITFDPGDGGYVYPTSGITGTGSSAWKLASLPAPSRTDYAFNGWFTAATGGVEVTTNTEFGGSITIYAQWTPIYTITFDANYDGGTVSPVSGKTGANGRLASLPKPTRSGYAFKGWYMAATGGVEVTESMAFGASITIYAQWTPIYTIMFDANWEGGTVSPSFGTTGADSKLASLPTPTRPGFVFDGWFTAATGGVEVTTNRVFYADGTIYAQWITPYTITFNANGGTVSPAFGRTGADYKLASLPEPTRAGYVFNGWYQSATGGAAVTANTTFASDRTIYAQWIEPYTITFNPAGGIVNPTSGTTGAGYKLASLPAPTKADFVFNGWYTTETGGDEVTTNTPFTASGIIFAQWITSYTIMFDAADGDVSPASGTTGVGYKLASLPTPTNTGFEFIGWYTTAATGGDEVTAATEFSADGTIYARWIASSRTVTFDPNGGTVTPTASVTGGGGKLASLPTPAKIGYTFTGWYTAETGGDSVTINRVYGADATIYARWTLKTYTIKFNANGGTVTPDNGATGEGWKLASLPVPERAGYAFDGWYTASTGGEERDESSVYTANETIYAQWTLITYTITFNATGGEVTPESGETGAGWKLASLPAPTWDGYKFDGWFTEKTDGEEVTKNTVFDDDAAVYAQWTLITYTITFNATGGNVTPASGTTGAGWKLASLPAPTRDGYTFDGWFTANTGGDKVTAGTVFDGNATIYARWKSALVPVVLINNKNNAANPRVGDTLTAVLDDGDIAEYSYSWKLGGVSIGAADKAYIVTAADIGGRITLEVSESGETYTVRTAAVIKGAKPDKPSKAPDVERVTYSAVKLAVTDGYEYAIDVGGGAKKWQESSLFNGLTPNTQYTFYQRVAETKAAYASLESSGKSQKTAAKPVQSGLDKLLVKQRNRPEVPRVEEASVVPSSVSKLVGEFTAGPNPVSKQYGMVNFYRNGKQLASGELRVYDVNGNVISKVKISDLAIDNNVKRQVGSWDLKDASGRPVSSGTYLVKGVLKTIDGKVEKVSLILGIR